MRLPLACALFLSMAASAPAADDTPDPKKAPVQFHGLSYRLVGPFAGGRVSRACGVPGDPLTYYAATASGGVWKSTDGGLNWKPIFDDQPTSQHRQHRRGPERPERRLRRLRRGEHPRQRVARGGHLRQHGRGQDVEARLEASRPDRHDGRSPEEPGRGVRGGARPRLRAESGTRRVPHEGRREDLGDSVLFKNDETGCSDVAIDPNNPRVVFAGFWQTRRRPWDLTSGGPGSDLLRLAATAVTRGIVSRRRKDVKKTRTARGRLGQGRRRRCAVEAEPRLRHHRSREGRPVPLRRRRRDVGARQSTTASSANGPGTTARSPSTRRTRT